MPYETRSKMGRTSPKVRVTMSHRNFPQRTHPIRPIGPKTDVLVCFVLFGCIRDRLVAIRIQCKTGRTSSKVCETKSRRTFRNEHTRSTPLDPKLMFWCISYYLGAFGTAWWPYETRSKTGRTSAKFRATKSRRNFSQRMHPIHPIRP